MAVPAAGWVVLIHPEITPPSNFHQLRDTAGRAAEKHLIGSASSGADDDIKRATELARAMVTRWGMSDEIGPVDLRQRDDHPFLGQTMAQPREHADQTAARVDDAVSTLLKDAEAEATGIITRHEKEVRTLIDALATKEVLDFKEIESCLKPVASVVTPLLRKNDDNGSAT